MEQFTYTVDILVCQIFVDQVASVVGDGRKPRDNVSLVYNQPSMTFFGANSPTTINNPG